MKYYLMFFMIAVCSCETDSDRMERSKKEIMEAEKAFALMADKEGIDIAFLEYADENAVLMRNNSIIKGHNSIKAHFSNLNSDGGKLTWSPDFVDVAASGDLGYTYGKYLLTSLDSVGSRIESTGIFHTVWKRQKDGTWKFVWD